MIVKVFWLMDLAFTRHGQKSIGLRLNFEGLLRKAGAVVSTNRIADLDNLLRREEQLNSAKVGSSTLPPLAICST